jgi:cell pole-organizing protein PopZ
MEEILASIRRIIADDDAKAPAAAPTPPRQAAPPPPAPPPAAPQPAPTPPRAEPAPLAKQAGLKQDEIDLVMKAETIKPAPAPEAPAEVVNLTESMIAPMPQTGASAAAKFQTIDAEPDVVFKEPDPPPAARRYPEPPQQTSEPLISGAASAAINSAFNTLAHTVLVQNARTLEDLVREMLRPMLKTWLDDNLPGIVERLVRAEIERVSRGRS